MSKQTTLRDVAAHCGLSLATVSRVLSDSSYTVSEATRQRVLDSARLLNYTPNELGKSLKTRSTHDIGVILPNITNPYYALLLQGITDEAERCGYHILLCSSHRNPKREAENISMLISKRVDGILLSSINPDARAVQTASCPLLAIEQPLSIPCPLVGFDYRGGAMMAARHLIGLGHERIAFIGAPLDRPSRRMMLEGYRAALTEHGIPLRSEYELLDGVESERRSTYEIENGQECARRILRMNPMPTACVCLNDMTAIGAMRAFAENGVRVPEDVSLIGFDNIPFCDLTAPALTTVDQHARELGALSVRRLLGLDTDSPAPAPTLVLRQSTAEAFPLMGRCRACSTDEVSP